MQSTMKAALAAVVAATAAGRLAAFEKLMPVENPETHVAFKKYKNDKGTVEYDFRYYPDGRVGGYVILPEGDSGSVTVAGRTYELKGGRTDIGVCVPATAYPRYLPADNVVVKRWNDKRALVAASRGKTFDLVFVGDSITDYWEDPKRGLPVWERLSSGRSTLNLGFAGDGSEHTLWRIENGILDGFKARQISILIGANGGSWLDAGVAKGIKAVLDAVRERHPESQIILTALIPWGEKPDNYHRLKNNRTNAMIRKHCDGEKVVWLDFGEKLLDADGVLPRKMAADLVHPTEAGYEVWLKALMPLLKDPAP